MVNLANFSVTMGAGLVALGGVLAAVGWYAVGAFKSGARKREELSRLSLIASNTDNAVLITNSEGLIEWINSGLGRLSGYTLGEVTGKPPETVLLGRQPEPGSLQKIQAGLQSQQNFSVEMQCVHRNGHRYWLSMNFSPVFSEDDRLSNFIGIGTDVTSHQLEAEELARRSRHNELMLNAAGEGIYCVDLQGAISFINPAAARMIGWESEELVGRPATIILHQLRANQLPRSQDDHFMVAACRDGAVQSGEVDLFRRKDGTVFPVEFTSKSIFDEGYLVGTVVVFRDITERWQLESIRVRQEAQSDLRAKVAVALTANDTLPNTLLRCGQAIVDHLPDAIARIWTLTPDGQSLELHASAGIAAAYDDPHRHLAFGQMFAGSIAREAEPRLVSVSQAMVDPGEAEWLRSQHIAAMAGFALRVETRLVGVMAVYSREPLPEDTLELLGPVADLVAQVIVRKHAEEIVKEQAALLDKAQDAILVMDLNGACIYWNKSAERLYGWLAREAHGRKISELIYRDTSYFTRARTEAMEKGEWRGECCQVTRGDEPVVVECQWTLVQDDAGQPKSILIVNTDISAKKKIESQFLRTQRMESIGTLAGGIAHDLNNVLAPILMSVDVLKDKVQDEQLKSMLGIVQTSARRGADMVKQVLTFARGVDGERVHLQTRHLIKEVAKFIGETFPKSIQLRTSIAREFWPTLGDATQLHQVLVNLSVNARDAMPDGGALTLAAENVVITPNSPPLEGIVGDEPVRPGLYAAIRVADTGTGIPQDILDKIFEPFFTTKEIGKGTGLGLSTVLGIVKSHGGFLRVQTDVGKGTTFTVLLPAVPDSEDKPLEAENQSLPVGHGELILAVDDEASVLTITKQTLENYGYRVLTAQDGTEALATFTSHRQQIKGVLTDMVMPYMDGPATIRALRRIDPDIRIIAASGLMDGERVKNSSGVDNIAYLMKPYTAEKLLTTLHKMLSERN